MPTSWFSVKSQPDPRSIAFSLTIMAESRGLSQNADAIADVIAGSSFSEDGDELQTKPEAPKSTSSSGCMVKNFYHTHNLTMPFER